MENTKRTLCIGDIHGGLKSLKQVLERSEYNPQEDRLIFLGDYCDGWTETAELIEYIIDLQKENPEIICILGNHDVWTQPFLEFGVRNPNWLVQGGQATVDSYIRTGHLIKDTHREFFRKLLPYYIDEENNLFVHGGFISEKGPQYEDYKDALYWDRSLWEDAIVLDRLGNEEYKKRYRSYLFKEVFIGHTTTGAYKVKPHYPEYQDENQAKNGNITVPMNRLNIWNIDTGGGMEGKLTILDIKTKKYWQSDFVKDLYKNG